MLPPLLGSLLLVLLLGSLVGQRDTRRRRGG
jgi:hypothetical protein